jgi:hypothetical protein
MQTPEQRELLIASLKRLGLKYSDHEEKEEIIEQMLRYVAL